MKDNLTLDRMWGLLERVGNPHEKVKVIHAAGTSGKTSTCYYVSELLRASGKNVGLTVSPHIYSITERIQINSEPISEQKFCDYLEEFVELLGDSVDEQSYFEFMIVFALWVFVQEKVDYAVVETGLGGLHDSTNVLRREDKVCVITDIGFDHQHILGNTLEEIATQKAGVIHKGNHVFFYKQSQEIMSVIQNQMKRKNATFTSVDEKNGVKLDDLAEYQKRNFTLAHATAKYVAKRDGFSLQEVNPSSVVIPGRMQKVTIAGKQLIVDGAHNPQKMKALVNSLQKLYPNNTFDIVLAMRAAKDYRKTVIELKPTASKVICSELSSAKTSSFVESVSAIDLAEVCHELGIEYTIEPNLLSAIKRAKGEPVIVTGSLFISKLILKNS